MDWSKYLSDADETQKNKTLVSKMIETVDDPSIKEFLHLYFDKAVKSYFWTLPASSTGKYHPETSKGVGGLVRHTLLACNIADSLMRMNQYENMKRIRYSVIAALLVHDSQKYGVNEGPQPFCCHDHPILAAEQLKYFFYFIYPLEAQQPQVSEAWVNDIAEAVSRHMGQWTTSTRSSVVLQEPETDFQKFVHLCDYLSGQTYMQYKED